MANIARHVKRIAPLTVFFAALIEFAIERARFDLWIMTVAVLILMATVLGSALVVRSGSQRPSRAVSVSARELGVSVKPQNTPDSRYVSPDGSTRTR